MAEPEFHCSFKRVAQTSDLDDVFACIAMIANKPIEEIRQLAIDRFHVPRHGPWLPSDELIIGLAAVNGWIAGPYKEAAIVADLPRFGLVLLDYDSKTQIGRHALFEKIKTSAVALYDPAYWLAPEEQMRLNVKTLPLPLLYVPLQRI